MGKKIIFDHYHKDDLVGTVIVDFEEELCYSKRNGKLFLFGDGVVSLSFIEKRLDDRLVPAGRRDEKLFLFKLGLAERDVWKMARSTHLCMMNDYDWIKFRDEEPFDILEFRKREGLKVWERA